MHLILANVSTFKSTPLPVAGSFTETTHIWNVYIYTPDPQVTIQLPTRVHLNAELMV
jgi:hypothetical protein